MPRWKGYEDIKDLGERNKPLRVDTVSKELKLPFSEH